METSPPIYITGTRPAYIFFFKITFRHSYIIFPVGAHMTGEESFPVYQLENDIYLECLVINSAAPRAVERD